MAELTPMKSDTAEGAAVFAAVQRQALAHPEVSFRFLRDGAELLHTAGDGGELAAVYTVLGRQTANDMQDVTLLREQSADITFASYSGLRVPKDAVRVDEKGQPGVYVLEGASAKWKPITILHDNGESYVVKLDKTSTDNLWPGDEVIVNAKNLYDGKVVE